MRANFTEIKVYAGDEANKYVTAISNLRAFGRFTGG